MSGKCIILGAGASFGYDETIPKEERAPKGIDLLSKALENGLLTKYKYPNFIDLLEQYAYTMGKDNKTYSDIDIEEFLEKVVLAFESARKLASGESIVGEEELNKLIDPIRLLFKKLYEETQSDYDPRRPAKTNNLRSVKLQSAIGEATFLIWELLKIYTLRYRTTFDSYQRLALYHLEEPFNLISLNYDAIFEMAAMQSGLNIQYSGTPAIDPFLIGMKRIINVAKVHGSVNWFNLYSKGIAVGGAEKGYSLLHRVSNLFYTNHINTGPPIIVNPTALFQIDINHLLMSGDQYYEPVIIPPIGKNKDYEKVVYFKTNWEAAGNMVANSNEIILIGVSLREQDTRLRDLLANRAKKGLEATVVGSESSLAALKTILGKKLKGEPRFIGNFSSFAKNL